MTPPLKLNSICSRIHSIRHDMPVINRRRRFEVPLTAAAGGSLLVSSRRSKIRAVWSLPALITRLLSSGFTCTDTTWTDRDSFLSQTTNIPLTFTSSGQKFRNMHLILQCVLKPKGDQYPQIVRYENPATVLVLSPQYNGGRTRTGRLL